ncbi:MAG: hypothetical protein HC768_22670 [Acaryochloris sp. CRU_2_0]|nr:hypothetical protein [Acaryochloris sp. CRU_2_0]
MSTDDQDVKEMIGASREFLQALLKVGIDLHFMRPPKVTATFKQAVEVAREGQQRGFSAKELSEAIQQTGVLDSVKAQGGDVNKAESLILRQAKILNAVQQFPSSPQRDRQINRQEER